MRRPVPMSKTRRLAWRRRWSGTEELRRPRHIPDGNTRPGGRRFWDDGGASVCAQAPEPAFRWRIEVQNALAGIADHGLLAGADIVINLRAQHNLAGHAFVIRTSEMPLPRNFATRS